MTLFQYKNSFRYTSDTMFLFDFILNIGIKGSGIDVGAGCGILGLLLSKHTNTNLTLIEKNSIMAELCNKNATENGIEVNIVNSDFLDFKSNEKFDFVVSNPPYYKHKIQKSENKNIQMARYDDNLPLDLFIKKAYDMLKLKGSFMFCYDSSRLADIFNIVNELKPKAVVENLQFLHSKQEKPSKLVFVHIKKDSKAHTKIKEPFVVFQNETYSQKSLEIFLKADCKSVDI